MVDQSLKEKIERLTDEQLEMFETFILQLLNEQKRLQTLRPRRRCSPRPTPSTPDEDIAIIKLIALTVNLIL